VAIDALDQVRLLSANVLAKMADFVREHWPLKEEGQEKKATVHNGPPPDLSSSLDRSLDKNDGWTTRVKVLNRLGKKKLDDRLAKKEKDVPFYETEYEYKTIEDGDDDEGTYAYSTMRTKDFWYEYRTDYGYVASTGSCVHPLIRYVTDYEYSTLEDSDADSLTSYETEMVTKDWPDTASMGDYGTISNIEASSDDYETLSPVDLHETVISSSEPDDRYETLPERRSSPNDDDYMTSTSSSEPHIGSASPAYDYVTVYSTHHPQEPEYDYVTIYSTALEDKPEYDYHTIYSTARKEDTVPETGSQYDDDTFFEYDYSTEREREPYEYFYDYLQGYLYESMSDKSSEPRKEDKMSSQRDSFIITTEPFRSFSSNPELISPSKPLSTETTSWPTDYPYFDDYLQGNNHSLEEHPEPLSEDTKSTEPMMDTSNDAPAASSQQNHVLVSPISIKTTMALDDFAFKSQSTNAIKKLGERQIRPNYDYFGHYVEIDVDIREDNPWPAEERDKMPRSTAIVATAARDRASADIDEPLMSLTPKPQGPYQTGYEDNMVDDDGVGEPAPAVVVRVLPHLLGGRRRPT